MEHSEEISGAFLKACCQPAHIFHLAKEAFDEISLGVEDFIVWDRIALVTFRGNDGEGPFIRDLLSDFLTAIGFVSNDGERWEFPVEKGIHHLAIMDLSAGYIQSQWPT